MTREITIQQLEKVLSQTKAWLLRDEEDINLKDIYSEDILNRYGPNLRNDIYVRILRKTIKYLINED